MWRYEGILLENIQNELKRAPVLARAQLEQLAAWLTDLTSQGKLQLEAVSAFFVEIQHSILFEYELEVDNSLKTLPLVLLSMLTCFTPNLLSVVRTQHNRQKVGKLIKNMNHS